MGQEGQEAGISLTLSVQGFVLYILLLEPEVQRSWAKGCLEWGGRMTIEWQSEVCFAVSLPHGKRPLWYGAI